MIMEILLSTNGSRRRPQTPSNTIIDVKFDLLARYSSKAKKITLEQQQANAFFKPCSGVTETSCITENKRSRRSRMKEL